MAEKIFEYIAGAICLDFANTISGARGQTNVSEHLNSYRDLLNWGQQAGLLSAEQAVYLEKKSKEHKIVSNRVLDRARNLRESIYRIFSAVAVQKKPAAPDLAVINNELARGLCQSRIISTPSGFMWGWEEPVRLDSIIAPPARSAADLLASAVPFRVRECANPSCTWLFIDETKNHSRRWCNMRTCGNADKIRRFRSRHRQ
ncbi:CGNR zinc finger domain-containing protein [Sporolactobacillus sp. KGMB 08714]|uniref:CGNR zinc finger domain-containing protein n=1 Tax=Sporolactobacillus sp. KGMB 08714 TaxID=3064704 RepID=UPI002FBD7E7F